MVGGGAMLAVNCDPMEVVSCPASMVSEVTHVAGILWRILIYVVSGQYNTCGQWPVVSGRVRLLLCVNMYFLHYIL